MGVRSQPLRPSVFLFCSAPSLLQLLMFLLLSTCHLRSGLAQMAPANPLDSCNGIFLTYSLDSRNRIHPLRPNDPANQPYSFGATASIRNSDTVALKAWSLHVGFPNGTVIVSANPAVLSDGSSFPAVVGPKGASFSIFPGSDLPTPIETAGDLTQIQVSITIIGTMFGSPPPAVPMPTSLSLDNQGYVCPRPTRTGGANGNKMHTCCTRDSKIKFNDNNSTADEQFTPRRSGDLTITYDVTQSSTTDYLALVTIANGSPLGRLDNWRLNWKWRRGEFIYSMRGAYTSVINPSQCIFGAQGQFYKDFDFSKVVNCQDSPTILDLPLSMANNTDVGLIQSCCRNGTILPAFMDPGKSVSAFQLRVYKMPPDLNRTKLFPPVNWRITGDPGSLNPDYQCGQPVRVSPTQFPDQNGLQATKSAIASWQVVCNITRKSDSSRRCCVSFSAFYNDSVVPCKTCACGCPANSLPSTCNATAPALLLPSEALLVPFSNRTTKALAWAELKRFNVPKPLPCPDNCGVSINWHINTDFSNGWTARVTLFNWEDASLADWFSVIQMSKAYPGYEAMYSFNGTAMGNNTIFMQGLPGLNYLMGETAGANPAKDPRVPGKQQTVISFTKKTTPGINVGAGDGFPTKVFFNGEECSIPDIVPTNSGYMATAAGGLWRVTILLAVAVIILMEQ